MVNVFCDENHLLTSVFCIADFHKSLSLMVESVSSESESDTLIYENVVEIKQKKTKKKEKKRKMGHLEE